MSLFDKGEVERVRSMMDKIKEEQPSLMDNYLHPERAILKKVYQDLLLKKSVQYRTRRLIFEHYEKGKG